MIGTAPGPGFDRLSALSSYQFYLKHSLAIIIPSIMFVVGFYLYSERVILLEFLFPLSSKTNISKYKFDLDGLMHNHFVEW